MQRTSKRYDNAINRIKSKNLSLGERQITFSSGAVTVFYIKQLTDRKLLAEQVIRPLMMMEDSGLPLKTAELINTVIFSDDCMLDTDENMIEQHVLNGMSVMLVAGDNQYAVINLKKVEKRSVAEPEAMYSLRGPRDCFTENLDSNLSLIRYRMNSESLRIEMMEVGDRIKSQIAVIYFEDIANNNSIAEVKKRIGGIRTDGLCSSGELQHFMLNNNSNLFPQTGLAERSDMACGALLEGKIVIIMDGDPWVLIAPKVFQEFLWSCDDYYVNVYFGTFMRFLRVIALNLTFIVSALYVAVVSFHSDTLPGPYIIAIAKARAQVPFNALIEVLLIELIAELIRESLVRVPSKIGTAIGIVGAIIIGQAAVSAGVFSPLLLIIVSMSLIASFVPADFTIVHPFRVLKFLLIIATGVFGFYGFTLVIVFVVAQLVSINSFGVPYMAPLAPFTLKDLFKSIVYKRPMAVTRPAFLRTKDNTRGPTNKPPEKTDSGQK